ncbi:hypothetical protein [Thermofilum pendens]|nr:hypothetical protein [Thermofilum pendens]
MLRRVLAVLVALTVLAPALYAQPVIGVKKTVVREMDVVPGCSYNTTATVTLIFDGDVVLNFTDYVAYPEEGDVASTEPPASSLVTGNLRATTWRNLNVTKGYSLKYSVPSRSLFNVSVQLSADGKPLKLNCSSGYCVAQALKAKTLEYTLTVSAIDPLLSKLQLPISVSWSVDPAYLYPVAYSENPQSVRESGTEVSFQWSSVINGSYSLSVVFEIRGENPWGEVAVSPPIVTVTLDPRVQAALMSRYKSFMYKFLESNLGNLTQLEENVTQLRDLLYNLSKGFGEEASMLESAAGQAEQASSYMFTAAQQIKNLSGRAGSLRGEAAAWLQNASELVAKAKEALGSASRNASLTDEKVKKVLAALNSSAYVNVSAVTSLIEVSRNQLGEVEGLLERYKSILAEIEGLQGQASEAAENLASGAQRLRLMSSMLREAAYNLRSLSEGLARAASLIDSSLGKLSKLGSSSVMPEGFDEYNRTFYSQVAVSLTPGVELRTEMMGEVYYFSLPYIKVKRSVPDVSGVKLESPSRRVASAWPLALLVVFAGAALALGKRGSRQSSPASEEALSRIRSLKERISRIEVGVGA